LIAVKPEVNSVADYFGLPLGKTMNVSALPFRSHNIIFNDWFRDENLQPLSIIGKIGVESLPNAVRRKLKVSPGNTSSTKIGTIRPASQVNLEPWVGKTMNVSALPFRSHNIIFNDWFRDENLQPSLAVPVNDGPDSQSDYNRERNGRAETFIVLPNGKPK
jgi:hypothetical protein